MVRLLNSDLTFIDRTMHGPSHIASKAIGRSHIWQTCCGRSWHRGSVSELTTRELPDNAPNTIVCRACKKSALFGDVRIEE